MYCALFNVFVLQVFKRYAVDGVVAIAIAIAIAIAQNVRCWRLYSVDLIRIALIRCPDVAGVWCSYAFSMCFF